MRRARQENLRRQLLGFLKSRKIECVGDESVPTLRGLLESHMQHENLSARVNTTKQLVKGAVFFLEKGVLMFYPQAPLKHWALKLKKEFDTTVHDTTLERLAREMWKDGPPNPWVTLATLVFGSAADYVADEGDGNGTVMDLFGEAGKLFSDPGAANSAPKRLPDLPKPSNGAGAPKLGDAGAAPVKAPDMGTQRPPTMPIASVQTPFSSALGANRATPAYASAYASAFGAAEAAAPSIAPKPAVAPQPLAASSSSAALPTSTSNQQAPQKAGGYREGKRRVFTMPANL
jgi:hypothetical protein